MRSLLVWRSAHTGGMRYRAEEGEVLGFLAGGVDGEDLARDGVLVFQAGVADGGGVEDVEVFRRTPGGLERGRRWTNR